MITKANWDFIGEREGGQHLDAYVPEPKSGVTIATGFDIGQHNINDLKKYQFGDILNKEFTPFLAKSNKTLTGDQALAVLKVNPLSITKEQADFVDKQVKNKFERDMVYWYESNVPEGSIQKFINLPEPVQTAAMSTRFNYGSFSKCPKYADHILNNDYQGMTNELRDFGGPRILEGRRLLEADYLEKGLKREALLSEEPLTVQDIASQYTGTNGKEIAELYIKHSYVNPNHFNLSENTLKTGYGSHHHMELAHQIYDHQPSNQKDINLATYQAKELIQKDSLGYLQGQSKFQGFPIIDEQAKSSMIAEVDTLMGKFNIEETREISTAIKGLNKTLSQVNLSYDDLKNHLSEGTKIQDIPEIKAYDLAKNPQKQNIFTRLFSSPKETPISDYTDRVIRRYNQIEKSIETKSQTLTGKIDHFKSEISHINISDETNQIINTANASSSTYLQGHLNVSLLSKMEENSEQILMEFNESQNSIIKASSYLLPSGSQQKTVDTFLEKSNQPLSNTIKENLSRVTSDMPHTQTSVNQSLQSLSQSPASMVHEYEYQQKLELQQILDENISESSSISM